MADAFAASVDEDVIYLPAGRYRFDVALSVYGNARKSHVTLRGAGLAETVIDCRAPDTCLSIGTGADYAWNWPTEGNEVTAGLGKGSTTVTIAESRPSYGPAGNVFGYNVIEDSRVDGSSGQGIDSNHGPHTSFNLYEGNASPNLQSDAYFGSESHGRPSVCRLIGMTIDLGYTPREARGDDSRIVERSPRGGTTCHRPGTVPTTTKPPDRKKEGLSS